MTVKIDEERFENLIDDYSAIGGIKNGGLNRLALTDSDKKVRNKFSNDLKSLGLEVKIDEIGNIFGRYPGKNDQADPILIGSHLDSQPNGGKFDGQLGILSALETVLTLADNDITPKRPVEIVNWTNEEGARFKRAVMGSYVFVGELDLDDAYLLTETGNGDKTVEDELSRIGYKGEADVSPDDYHSYLELHIECGPELEINNNSIGIVDQIYSSSWLEVTINGKAKHAGQTPMNHRNDAFASTVDASQRILTLPNRLDGDSVATIGELHCSPNKRNIIPSEVTFSVDYRASSEELVEKAKDHIRREVDQACSRHETEFEIEEVQFKEASIFNDTIMETIEEEVNKQRYPYQYISSIAGHDAKPLNKYMNAGMIMVPSVDGECHSVSEHTEIADAIAGANVLTNTALDIANG